MSEAQIDRSKYRAFHEWGGYVVGVRNSVGSAARRNRGSYSGSKVHRIVIEEIIEIKDPSQIRPGSFGARFLKTGKPVVFSARPMCGCTQGQNAAREQVGAVVSCSKCGI